MLARLRTWWRLFRVMREFHSHHGGKRSRALTLLWRGEVSAARRLLSRQNDEVSTFQLACLGLEVGDVAAAERWANRMAADPARDVVMGMIAQRVGGSPYRGGDTSWLDSLYRAWETCGRPDLRTSKVLGDDFYQSWDPGTSRTLSSMQQALWLQMTQRRGFFGSSTPSLVAWATRRSESDDLPVLVIAASVMSSGTDAQARAAPLHDVRTWIARRQPENLFAQLAVSKSLDLDELERIVALPRLDLIVPGVYEYLLAIATKAGSRSPELLAYTGTLFATLTPDLTALLGSFDASPTRRAAQLYVKLGLRLRGDTSMVSAMYSMILVRRGATALGDVDLLRELAPYEREAKTFMHVSENIFISPIRWPLPSLCREALARLRANEVGFYRDIFKRQSATTL